MSKKNEQIATQVGATLVFALILLVVWEFGLEHFILSSLLDTTIEKTAFQRWEFVIACLVIVALSVSIPFLKFRKAIDELKSVEETLRGEKTLSRIFFNVDNSILIVVDTANQIMQINKKAVKILGYKEEELLGKDWIHFLVKKKERETYRRDFLSFVKDPSRQFKAFTMPVHDKASQEHTVEWQAAPLLDENEQVYGTILSGQDVTRQNTLAHELESLKTKYEPKIKKLTQDLDENRKKYHQEAIKTAHAKARFKYWFDLEDTLIALSPKEWSDPEKLDPRICKALEDYGVLCDVDHGFIYMLTPDGESVTNTHIWVSDEPFMEPDSDSISLNQLPWLKEKLESQEILHIPNVDELPEEAVAEQKHFILQGVKSLIIAPLVSNRSTIGYLGFETTQNLKTWDQDEIGILKIVARQMTHLLAAITGSASYDKGPEDGSGFDMEDGDVIGLDAEEAALEADRQSARGGMEQELKGRIAKLEKARADLESRIENSKKMESQLRSTQKELENKLLARTEELEQATLSLNNEKKTRQKLEEQAKKSGAGTEAQLAEKAEQVKTIQEKLNAELEAKKQLDQQMTALQQAHDKELAAKNEELEKLRDLLEQERKARQEEQSTQQAKTPFAANLEKQLSNKSLELQKVQAQLETELRAKEKREEKLKIDHTVLEKKLADKETEIEGLKSQLETAAAAEKELERKVAKTRIREHSAEEKKREEKRERERQEEVEALKLQLEEYKSEVETKTTQLSELKKEFEELKAVSPSPEELETIQAQIDAKDLEIQQLHESLDEAHVAKNWVETELKKMQEAMDKQKEDFEVLETARSMLQTEIDELRELQGRYEETRKELEDLQQDMENLEIANQQMLNDLEDKDYRIKDLEYQNQRIEHIDLPVFTMNTGGTIMSWNRGAQNLTGYYTEAAQGQPLSFLFPRGEEIDLQRDILDPLWEKGSVNVILPLSFANGGDDCPKAIISLSLFQNGTESDEAIGVIADISDDRKTDESLQQLKDYYDSVLKKSGLIPVTLTSDFEIAEFGPEAETTLQWHPQQTAGKNFFETVMPDTEWKTFSSQAADKLQNRSAYQFECSTPVGSGEKRAMIWNLIRESQGGEEPAGVLAVGQDIHEMRERENNIKEREALLASIIDQAVDGFITIDESGIIQSFNSTAEHLFGYSSTEMVGHNISTLMPEPYRSEHGNYLSRYIQTGKANLVGKEPREFLGLHKDGSTFPIEVAVREIYQGYRRLFVGIIHDVSRRKQFEISAKENEDKFRKLLEAESDAIFIVNLGDHRILDGNEAASKLFGYDRRELGRLNYKDLEVSASGGVIGNGQSGALGLGPRRRSQFTHFNKKDGTVFPAQVMSSSFMIQNEKLCLYIIRDVTPQMKAEETIQESQRHLRDILNQASVPVYLKDTKGRYTLANTAFQKLFHASEDQILGKTDHDVFPADIADTLARTDEKALEKGQAIETTESILHDDGIHNYQVVKHPLRNSSGVLYGLCGVLTDITTRTRLESELARLQADFQTQVDQRMQTMRAIHEKRLLTERLASAAQAMTGLSNQISNPIHGIQNILEQLSERVAMEEIHKGLMTVALNECQRIADLSQRLKECEIPKLEEPEPVDLHALLKEYIHNGHQLKEGETPFVERLAPSLPAIEGNRGQMALALHHLLQNALEANTDPEGKITIATEAVDDAVKVYIQDSGCGIPEEIRDRIFDPFFTTKKVQKRAGLGLMMVLGVIKNHGGEIDVISETGKGTTVTLTLPIKQKQPTGLQ